MKVLDVHPFHEGLQRNINMLARLETEMQAIERMMEELVAMEDSLKGQGGDAIRAFYKECHLPFLQFFMTFKSSFTDVLGRMDAALDSLEPNRSGFIREEFLEGEIEQGLKHIGQLTESLTNEANSIMNQVADIVSLPHLDDSEVQEGTRNAGLRRDETVNQLNEFDRSQTNALTTIADDLGMMETWIANIEGLFTYGLTGVNFPAEQWKAILSQSPLKTTLTHRTAPLAGIAGMAGLYGPGTLYGTSAYAFPGMFTYASPLANFGINDATVSTNSIIMTAGGQKISSELTCSAPADIMKSEQENKIGGFLKGVADFLILDDLNTIADPDASLVNKGIAVASLLPVGKILKLSKADDLLKINKVDDAVEETSDRVDDVAGKGKNISHPVLDNTRSGSALKKPDGQHGFNDIIDNYTPHAKEFEIAGGDGVKRNLYQIEGGMKYYDYKDVYNKDLRITERVTIVKDQNGIFEWIVDPTKGVTHRRFIPNGQITGSPNQRP
jgi:toxin YxiD